MNRKYIIFILVAILIITAVPYTAFGEDGERTISKVLNDVDKDDLEDVSHKLSYNYIVNTSDPKVVTYDKSRHYLSVEGVGTCIVTGTGWDRENLAFEITVTRKYMNDYIKYMLDISDDYDGVWYGSNWICESGIKGSTFTVYANGEKYSAKAVHRENFDEYVDTDWAEAWIKVPQSVTTQKIGTKIKIESSLNGGSYVYYKKILKPDTSLKIGTVYKTSKKIKLKLKDVYKGDVISVKIGKSTYKKKIKKDKDKYTYIIKPKKLKAGGKISIVYKNKHKQKILSKKIKIYYASRVKLKMTKKQCRLVPGWEHPIEIDRTGNYLTWYYDDDGNGTIDSWLVFYKGRLESYHY